MPKVSPVTIYTCNFADQFCEAALFHNDGSVSKLTNSSAPLLVLPQQAALPCNLVIKFNTRFGKTASRFIDCIVFEGTNIKSLKAYAGIRGEEFELGFSSFENNGEENLMFKSNTVFEADTIRFEINSSYGSAVKIGKIKVMREVFSLCNALTAFTQKDSVKKSQYYSLCGKLYLWRENIKKAGSFTAENLPFADKEALERIINENTVLNFRLYPDEKPQFLLEAAVTIADQSYDRVTGVFKFEAELTEV